MENILYTELAEVYALIADDQDFDSECADILKIYQELSNKQLIKVSVLELFAGPAYHTSSFLKNYKVNAWAVDYSTQMKTIAHQNYDIPLECYITGLLPSVLEENFKGTYFDIILIMRYSLGLLTYEEAEVLLKELINHLNSNGIIIIELHKIDLLIGQFSNLKIKERRKAIPNTNKTINCQWPSGNIEWNDESWLVKMPISVELLDTDQVAMKYKAESTEYLFTAADIVRMLQDYSHAIQRIIPKVSINNFNQSKLIILRRIK